MSRWRSFDPLTAFGLSLAVCSAAAFGVLAWQHRVFTVDDAYITLRYAANLAAGHGATWNASDPPTEGYTTFLWMVAMALPHLAGWNALAFAKVAGVLSMLGCAVGAAWLARTMCGGASRSAQRVAMTLAVVVTMASTGPAVHAVSGMETTFFTLLVTVFLAGLVDWTSREEASHVSRARSCGVALLALGAALTRPEGNLLAGVAFAAAFLLYARHRRALVLAATIGWVAPYALYFLWRYSYYGLLAPLSFYVKTMNEQTALTGADEALGVLHLLFVARPEIGIGLVAGAAARPRRALLVLAPATAIVCFFLLPAPIMAYEHRYLFPVLPGLQAVAAVGAAIAAERGARVLGRVWSATDAVRSSAAFAAVLLLFAARAGFHVSQHAAGSIAGWTSYGEGLVRAHVKLGRDLLARKGAFEKRPTVALVDVGAVAYVSGWDAIDTFGLNDVHIARSGRHDPEYVKSRDPDMVVFISQTPDRLVPHLKWEKDIHDAFVACGYTPAGTYHFADDYYLLAFERPPLRAAADDGTCERFDVKAGRRDRP
jgi:arabinofuranosyltransferase